MQQGRRPGRQAAGDKSIKPEEVGASFHDAIWDAAGKFSMLDKKGKQEKKEDMPDELVWKEKDVLSFADFCASPEHMNFPTLSPRQKRVAEYMFGDNPKRIFDTNRNTAVLVWGKGSGKDTLSALMILYVVYVLLCMRNPQQFLGLPDNSSLDLLNVAASKQQAQEVFFDIFKTMVLHWPWIKKRHDVQISGRFFSSAASKNINILKKVIVTNDAILFPHNIRAFSGTSEAETLEGKNLLMFVLDEADAFKEIGGRSAKKIHRMCRTSAFSRFKKRFKGFIISYPRSKNGFILTLYEQTKRFLNVYSDIAMTWEVKPRDMFSMETFDVEGHQVPMDFFDEFRLDPIDCKRAYMCMAPMAEDTFLKEEEKILAAITSDRAPLFTFKTTVKDGLISKTILSRPYFMDPTIRYMVTIDLGEKVDPAVITMTHRDGDKIVMDFTVAWVPVPKEGKEKHKSIRVDLVNFEEVLLDICQTVSLQGVFGDHWNSALFMAKIRKRGARANTIKLTYEDYVAFRKLLYAGNIELIKNTQMLDELKNLQDFSSKKVDHPSGGHNDITVTLVMAVRMHTTIGKDKGSSELQAEGEYVGENMHEATDVPDAGGDPDELTIQIDGIPLL